MINSFNDILNDPEYIKAKSCILRCIHKHQSHITNIKESIPSKSKSYAATLEEFKSLRGSGLYYPYISSGIGHGPFIQLLDGSIKIDCINGIGVHYYGHSHHDIISASIDASVQDTVMEGHLQQGYPSCQLMNRLTKLSGMDHCFISTSGATACENALKIAFYNNHPAQRILAFEHCFMGRTLTLSQITDKPAIRPNLPTTQAVDYIPFYDPHDHDNSIKRSCHILEKLINRYPGQYAVMVFELIQGEGGINVGHVDFFKAIIRILKKNNILTFVDEVQTFLRTAEPFACQLFDITNNIDIISIGKASQICATLYRKELAPKPGLLSQTFTASSSAIMSSLSILDMCESNHLFGKRGKINRLYDQLKCHIDTLHSTYPDHIQPLSGCGTMCCITVFGGNHKQTNDFAHELFKQGLMTFVAGKKILKIRMLLPAIVLNESHLCIIKDIIEASIIKKIT